MNSEVIGFAAVLLFTTLAVSIDIKTRKIPKWLTIPATAAGLLYHAWDGGVSGCVSSLAGFATGFGILLVLWLIGSGGGGDVKLMGAVGSWLGAYKTLLVFVGSGAFAVICTIGIIVRNRLKREDARERWNGLTLPYALPVSLAVWALFFLRSVVQ